MNETEKSLPPKEDMTKKRKVRKGTRSCWECKRRKIRCIFPSHNDATCIECTHRRTTCVSQDLPEHLAPARQPSNSRHLGERIARIEKFINGLANSQAPQAQGAGQIWNLPPGKAKQDHKPAASNFHRIDSTSRQSRDALYIYSSSASGDEESESESNPRPRKRAITTQNNDGGSEEKRKEIHGHSSRSPAVPTGTSIQTATLGPSIDSIEDCELNNLLSAFPSEADAKILARQSAKPSVYTHLINTQSYSALTPDNISAILSSIEAASPIAIHPDPNTNPILLVRQMIIFAITLQSPSGDQVHGLSEPQGLLMHRLMKAAAAYMATKEDFCGTLESLLCIMLRGVFEVNCGNLRRAWATYRRAMSVAQLMGLHRSPIASLQRVDKRLAMDPAFMWFRIVYMDRYLSLLLGLPQGTADKLTTLNFDNEPPFGKFERQLAIIASQILERNESMFNDRSFGTSFATTHSTDAQLLGASGSMPSNFWRPANFQGLLPGSPESLLDTLRLATQVYHHSLLIQLYLPHAMYGTADPSEREYAKTTCMNAGREILTRFIAHRTFNPMSSCSRPVDFFAFLAAMTILLTHLDAHQESNSPLVHQRLSDRAMLEQATGRMDLVSQLDNDAMAAKSAEVIRHLLKIEADASEGVTFTQTMTQTDRVSQNFEKSEKELRLNVPCLGSIKIARKGHSGSKMKPNEPEITLQDSETVRVEHNPNTYHDLFMESFQKDMDFTTTTAGIDEWNLQGVEMAFFDSLMEGINCSKEGK